MLPVKFQVNKLSVMRGKLNSQIQSFLNTDILYPQRQCHYVLRTILGFTCHLAMIYELRSERNAFLPLFPQLRA